MFYYLLFLDWRCVWVLSVSHRSAVYYCVYFSCFSGSKTFPHFPRSNSITAQCGKQSFFITRCKNIPYEHPPWPSSLKSVMTIGMTNFSPRYFLRAARVCVHYISVTFTDNLPDWVTLNFFLSLSSVCATFIISTQQVDWSAIVEISSFCMARRSEEDVWQRERERDSMEKWWRCRLWSGVWCFDWKRHLHNSFWIIASRPEP